LHNFLPEQPDLNVRNPAVQDALLEIARFWLDRGVDGLRLDVVNFYVQDALLRDNPSLKLPRPPARPHQFQRHLYERSQPETLDFIARLRKVLDQYGAISLGEVEDEEPIKTQRVYTDGPERLHTAYSFTLLRPKRLTPQIIKDAMEGWAGARGWPSWSFSNHDVVRFPTRLADNDRERTKQMFALLLALRGTAFVYQGDELGLPHANVPFERLRDPEAIAFYPSGIGRDGARTPMPWARDAGMAGFTTAPDAWLPLDPRHRALAVDVQDADANSMLALARRMVALRKSSAALREGDFIALDAPDPVLAFERAAPSELMLCVFNLGGDAARWTSPGGAFAPALTIGAARIEGGEAVLGPFSALLLRRLGAGASK
jgi:alpha-glucosidase